MSNRKRALAYVLFFFSGVAGLTYQVVWVRQLALVFGSTLESTATTTAAFLCGLGLGARLAPRLRSYLPPGQLFAALELVVAASSLLLSAAFPHSQPVARAALEVLGDGLAYGLFRFAAVFLALLVPCVCMGATLPVLCLLLRSRDQGFQAMLAGLYALNTLGAAAGAVVGDFFLIREIGVFGTAAWASGLDLLVGIVGYRAFAGQGTFEPPSRYAGFHRELGLLFLCGFCGLALEILWVRVLVFFNGCDVYAFSSVVATYLFGTVLGSVWASRRKLRASLLLQGLSICVVLSLLSAPTIFPLRDALSGVLARVPFNYVRFLTDFWLILPSTIFLGALFPVLCAHLEERGGGAAESVGQAYLWNTLGALLGSLAAGFVLLTTLGLQNSLLLMAVLAALAAWIAGARPWLLGLLVLGCFAIPRDFLWRAVLAGHMEHILYLNEDPYGTVALAHEWNGGELAMCDNLLVDGFNMMANGMMARRYASALAAVPILAHPAPSRALVIAFGLGNTVRTAVNFPDIQQVHCVELTPTVIEATSRLAYVAETLKNPRLRIIFGDGRNYLGTTRERYDVITAEPPPPVHAGIVNLYSREYFEACRRCLNPGGIVSHWLPINQMSAFEARTILRAARETFPCVYLWQGSQNQLVLVASLRPLAIQWPVWRDRFAGNREVLRACGWDSPELMLASFLKDDYQVGAYVQNTPPLTDDRPYLQHYAGSWQIDDVFYFQNLANPPVLPDPEWAALFPRARQTAQMISYLLLTDWLPQPERGWKACAELSSLLPGSPYLLQMLHANEVARARLRERLPDPMVTADLVGGYLYTGQPEEARKLLGRPPLP